MKNFSFLLVLLSLACFSSIAQGQSGDASGVVSGLIIDGETGEGLIGVTIRVDGTATGTVTDFDGNYQLDLPAGQYTLVVTYVSYATETIENVQIIAGQPNRIDLQLRSEDIQLEEIVVQAEAINNNEVALLKLQKKSYAVQDGISVAEMTRIGVSNSAESMTQVTGASVEEGKYVVMRGLGDRYTLTQLNGIILPSTDPYRNSSNMDLIPTAMVENIVTTKTFTPDQPGNFSGGNVNVTTRSLPDQFYLSGGIRLTYNSLGSFIDNMPTDPVQGNTDWLGFDDGSRAQPAVILDETNREIMSDPSIYTRVRQLDETYDAEREVFEEVSKTVNNNESVPITKNSGLDHRIGVTFGDRFNIGERKLGYNAGLNYKRGYRFYPNRELRIWEFNDNANALNANLDTQGDQGLETATIGGILSLAYQFNPRNELLFNVIYNHDTEKSAVTYDGVWPGAISGNHSVTTRNISFLERQMVNYQLGGKHVLPILRESTISWIAGYTDGDQKEPDIRVFANEERNGVYDINKAEYDFPFHFWRELDDTQYNLNLDWVIPISDPKKGDKLKVGALYSQKDRDFKEYRWQLTNTGTRPNGIYTSFGEAGEIDPERFEPFFLDSNHGILPSLDNPTLQPPNDNRYLLGNYYLNLSRPSNFYTGTELVWATYAMAIWNFAPNWRFVGGARIEKTDYEVQSANPSDSVGRIDELDLLPSVSFIYAINDDSNLRLSGSQTLARPNMREMSPFVSVDLIGGFFYLGNPDIKRTKIINADIRYELFPKPGEIIAASAFFKSFDDPIVRVLTPQASGGEIRMDNSPQALLYGFELEYRKNITENWRAGVNFTWTKSEVDLTQEEKDSNEAIGANIGDTRPFQGQSPFLINLNLTYINFDNDLEGTVYLNMYGRRLYANGFGGAPDIYEILGRNTSNIPTPTLNFTATKGFGEHWDLNIRITNILNAETIRNQELNDQLFIAEAYKRGINFALGVNYNLYQH